MPLGSGYQRVQDAPSYLPGQLPSEQDHFLQRLKSRQTAQLLRRLPKAKLAAAFRSGKVPHLLGLKPKKLNFGKGPRLRTPG